MFFLFNYAGFHPLHPKRTCFCPKRISAVSKDTIVDLVLPDLGFALSGVCFSSASNRIAFSRAGNKEELSPEREDPCQQPTSALKSPQGRSLVNDVRS